MTIQEQCEQAKLAIRILNSRIKLFKEDGIAKEYIDGLEDEKARAKRELAFFKACL